MGKLLKFMSKKAQFSSKKLFGCFNWSPCGSVKKYKQCHGKQLKAHKIRAFLNPYNKTLILDTFLFNLALNKHAYGIIKKEVIL